jgi:two-component system phosphate regulon sensor histidine kinase PhoR
MLLLDTKNLSPSLLSLFTALVIATVNTLLALTLKAPLYMLAVIFGTTALITYLVYFYTLQEFIYRKIKLIYKFIYQTKATKREEYFNENILPRKSIEEVSADVQQWAIQRKDEIEKLQRNEDFRKEFLMNLAHELRTPIFTIQGYVDTLIDGALEDQAVNRKFLTATAKSVDRLAQLVDDLDEISRLESGRTTISTEAFGIQDLVRDVYEEFALQAAEKGMQLLLKKGTERTLTVHADKPKIRQVLVNIIENALKYGRTGGQVTTGCYAMDEGHIYVEISDDGHGISEEHLPRIFERFYRADRSRSRNIGGTGLGLAIVKHIVEAHGQTVTARSTPGVGSSFGFTLPK